MELIIAAWFTLLVIVPIWTRELGASEAMSGIIYAIMFTITFVVWIWLDEADRVEKERINQLFDKIDENMHNLACRPSDEEIKKDIEEAKRIVIEQSERKKYEMHN